ncbi:MULTISPECIES: alpha/beta fold hydrolase [Arthrobacter]|uniref:Alpha/beta hydrolase n=1 Tax=Arthrobacter caoxuetaonis TaxID=2886935 RepID=A0A9X1SCT5_9MICC|nr:MULTISPECIES: alpha/beta hydrolase [Arthrobacter]MCC3282837.1 alpha/beta hydrolase [Arthrobacter caoxuetaonis]MCC3297971.1 alpha/beta hydrolase [Arthrobacter caoxuetaonis]MCC9192235.1 alpha/beta hydrolase [Arthrobacter sp. zg-Y916]USQ56985.1 alpha/beta hydrolase [Arthrobacter caoxuetaonis]
MTTDVSTRNNVQILGNAAGPVVMFAHGFGCDQGMWHRMIPYFTDQFRVVVFDHVGSGGSDLNAYDPAKYATLDGYVSDLLEICDVLDLQDVTFVGHSVGAMMAVAAAASEPSRFSRLVLVASSPSYMDRPGDGYTGGFSEADIDELLVSLDSNYIVWAAAMAPMIMGNPDSPELHSELEGSFCRLDPAVARGFARVSFRSDVRDQLAEVQVPTLILQCSNDLLAPPHIGAYTRERMPASTLVQLKATGHLPHVSAPDETAEAILAYLSPRPLFPVPAA